MQVSADWVWRSWVARLLREQKVASSNLATQTDKEVHMVGRCAVCGYVQKETTPPCAKCGSSAVHAMEESLVPMIERLLEAFGLLRGN